jgi:Tfp pilus assembly protein PilV
MVFKIRNKFCKNNRGLGIIESILAVLITSIALVGLLSAFVYGKFQMQEESYRRLAFIAAQGEMEAWKQQVEGSRDAVFDHEAKTKLEFFGQDQGYMEAQITRDHDGPIVESMYEFNLYHYNLYVTITWGSDEEDEKNRNRITLEGRHYFSR